MSLAGFKKQINKANQYMSEKIGGAKGTELDDEFIEKERKMDVMGKLVEELIARTFEMLQPNAASRAKLAAMNSISKMRGQAKHTMYPQPEGSLGDCMIKYGKDMGEDSSLGASLVEAGEGYKQLADIKYALEDNVKQNFIEPLNHLQSKDLKEVNHHRKKMSGRRLDYDCKKRKQLKEKGSHITEAEMEMAEDKFAESKDLAETAMHNLLENDVEQVSQLSEFVKAHLEYHRQAMDILTAVDETLQQKRNEAANRPRNEFTPRRVASFREDKGQNQFDNRYDVTDNNSYSSLSNQGPATTYTPVAMNNTPTPATRQPSAKALYDFEPENPGELGFKEGEIIELHSQIDENWYEGAIHGQIGFFPVNYVEIVVPL